MNSAADGTILEATLTRFRADTHAIERSLALYAAAVAVCRPSVLDRAVECATRHGASPSQLYEIVLQSYLFLGFPRMLEGAQHLAETLGSLDPTPQTQAITQEESELWFQRGIQLYRQVYGGNHRLLRERVESFAPEIFRWMIVEGYGKVLSRPGLDPVSRELAIVAMLMMENRERQLHSHLRGSVNVGTPTTVLNLLIDDIGPAAGDGFSTARRLYDDIVRQQD